VASNSSIKGNSIKQRLIYPENILDQKTGQQFAEASRMFEEANVALAAADSDASYAPAVLAFASGYLLQPRIVDIERGMFSSPKGAILRSILLDKERRENLYKTDDKEFNNNVKIAAHILIAFEEFTHLNSLANVPKNMLGKIGVQTGEMIINSALKAWDDVIAIESENSLFWYMKGQVLGIIGRPEDAIICFKKGLEINPVDYRSAFGYAINSPTYTLKPKVIEETIHALDIYIENAPICDENMSHACFYKIMLITGKKLSTDSWKKFLDENSGLLDTIVELWKKGFKAMCILERWFPSRIDYQLYKKTVLMMEELWKEELIKDIEGVHVCDFCGKDNGKLMRCKGCNVSLYCSKEDQEKHWPKHKIICKKFQSLV
jgi:tetratricopeptide (TPR) repeat protein